MAEVDEWCLIDKSELATVLTRRSTPVPVTSAAGAATASSARSAAADANAPTTGVQGDVTIGASAATFGERFAELWLRGATSEDIRALLSLRPRIPQHLDVELLRSVEAASGRSLRGDDAAHRSVRAAFWKAVDIGAAARETAST